MSQYLWIKSRGSSPWNYQDKPADLSDSGRWYRGKSCLRAGTHRQKNLCNLRNLWIKKGPGKSPRAFWLEVNVLSFQPSDL